MKSGTYVLKTTLRKSNLLCLLLSLFVPILAPLTAHASAPQDTYTWASNVNTPSGCPLVSYPQQLVVANNKIYVTDHATGGYDRVDILDMNGNTLGQFGSSGSGNGQLNYPNGIAADSSGNLYVTDSGNNRVEKFDSNGNYLSKFGSFGSGNGQMGFPIGIGIDASDNIWVVDPDNFRVQEFDSNGNYLRQFGSNGTGNGQFSYPTGLTIDSTGNVWVADRNNNTLQKFSSTGVFIAKYDISGTLQTPYGLGHDAAGNIYVASSAYGIDKFDTNGNHISKISSQGFGTDQTLGAEGVGLDAAGNIYAADLSNRHIQKYDPSGNYVSTFIYIDPNGAATDSLCSPQDVAVGNGGKMYVSDAGWDNNVKIYNPDGSLERIIGQYGNANGDFNYPLALALDSSGNLLVVDQGNNRVEKFDANGNYLSQFGTTGSGNGQFSSPVGIALDSQGHIYVGDSGGGSPSTYFSRIQKFDSNGNYLSQFGTFGSGNGQFQYPGFIAVSSDGSIYAGDPSHNRVEKFDANGNYLSQFGSVGSGNGQFSSPQGIKIDSAGNILVADYSNRRVQKFDASGVYLGQFGTSGTGNGQFQAPTGITLDSAGEVYVADQSGLVSAWVPGIPLAPTQVTATATSSSTIDTNWQPVTSTPPVTGYTVEYQAEGASTWQQATVDGSTTAKTFTGLQASTQYNFKVFATNANGAGIESNVASATTWALGAASLASTGENSVMIGGIGIGVVLLAGSLLWRIYRPSRR